MNTQLNIQKLLTIGLLSLSSTLASASDFQQNMLFSPSERTLDAEAKGHIMIYDGLMSETVEKAMDEQFNRIGSMMFVRTRYGQPDGSIEEDNECED